MADTGRQAGSVGQLAALLANRESFTNLAREVASDSPAPGYMAKDIARRYMAQIYNAFSGVEQARVEMALAIWCILNDVGGEQSHSEKPPIVVDGIEVSASEVFGVIIPSDRRGLPRQFAATMFESVTPMILEARPDVRAALTPRVVARGLRAGDELAVVSFAKGGLPGSNVRGAERARAKDLGVRRSAPASQFEPAVSEVNRPSDGPPLF
jgi:hypothetical protein